MGMAEDDDEDIYTWEGAGMNVYGGWKVDIVGKGGANIHAALGTQGGLPEGLRLSLNCIDVFAILN